MTEYYTAKQAQERLGLNKAMFYRRVNEGVIKQVRLPSHKQALYVKRDIDALALAMAMVFEASPDRYVFSRSSPGDQVEEMDIGIRCFGNQYITPLPERIAFQQKSDSTFWSLKINGRVVGYVSMFRFPPGFLEDILIGRHIERDITVNEVIPFTRTEPFDVYIDVLAMDPSLAPSLRSWYAGVLLSRFADALLNLIGNGFRIRTLYTVTATPEGDRLVRELGFTLMEGKSLVPGRIGYSFTLDDAGIEQLKAHSRREVYHHAHRRTEN